MEVSRLFGELNTLMAVIRAPQAACLLAVAMIFLCAPQAWASGPSGAHPLRRVFVQGSELIIYASYEDPFLDPDDCKGDGATTNTIGYAKFVPLAGTDAQIQIDRAMSVALTALGARINVETYFTGCASSAQGNAPIFSQLGVNIP